MKRILTAIACMTSCMWAIAMTESIDIPTIGTVTLTCPDPNGWSFEMTTHTENDCDIVEIDLKNDSQSVPPLFKVGFRLLPGDIGYLWYANDNGRCQLVPSWMRSYKSNIASSIPLYTLLNGRNDNRFTVAVSEPFRELVSKVGVLEEGAYIEGELTFFRQPEAPMESYHTEIRFDRRDIFYGQAVSDATQWMIDRCGIEIAEVPEAAFDPLYSSWYQFHQDVSAGEIEDECRRASSMGMKTLILDDGWQTSDNNRGYSYCGDWKVCESKFPDMAAHVKEVHDCGIRYMMWYSVPYVGVNSVNHERFKNMYLTDRDDSNVLDPRFPEVREFLCSTYENALREWNIDGLKLDFIDEFNLKGMDPAVKDNYAGRDIKSLPAAVDTLMNEVRRRLQAIKPDVLIEFRQSYIGPAIRQYGNMLRASDCPVDAEGNRRYIAMLRLTSGNTAVHSDMLEWNVGDTPQEAAHHILSALFGVVQYSMKLSDLPADHQRMMKHWIDFTQRHRNTLLKADFRPYYPQAGYPVIEAESDEELIVGLYNGANVASVGNVSKPVWILNATGEESVIAELASKPRRAEVFDTFGTRVATVHPAAGINRIRVPHSGYVMLKY